MDTLVTLADHMMLPDLEEIERPPGPGPGLLLGPPPPPPLGIEDDVLPDYGPPPPPPPGYPGLPAPAPMSPRLRHGAFMGGLGVAAPPPVAVLDYQPDHSSNFTQTFLRGILTSIDSKDPVVANAWLETLLDAIDLLPIEVIKQEIIVIAINKSQLSQPPFSRMAAAKILGKLSTKLDQQAARQEVLPSTLALCQDAEAEVRTVMCRHLAMVARGIGLELTKSALLPVLVELSQDGAAGVRLAAIETVVALLPLLDDEVATNTIVPLVIKSCEQARALEDCTLPVIARHLGRLCHGLSPNLSAEQKAWFITYYQQLARLGTAASAEVGGAATPMPDLVPRSTEPDKTAKYTECRQACAYNLPGMVLFVGANNFSEKLFSTFCDFAADSSPLVRKTLASSLHELIKIIGTNFCLLKMQIVALFNDSNIDVLSSMVFNMVYVIDGLARFGVLQFGSTSSYSQELSVAILHMEEVINMTRNWRLHADCLEKLSCLANCISAAVIQLRYIPLLFLRAHKSRPLPTRVAAVRTLLVILRFTVKQEDRTAILDKIKTEFARGKSSHSRMLYLKMCEMAVCLFSKLYFKQSFLSELLTLSQDAVPNIRLKVVSLLPQLKSLLVLPADSAHLLHLEDTIKELLVVETDRDVLGSLQTSIHHLADIETALEGMSKLGLYSEEDVVDDRKLREERLIANMEEQIKQVQGAKLEQLIAPSAIPSRLRSLALDRKRSESLPPAGSRAEAAAKPRYSSPEPQRLVSALPGHAADSEPSKLTYSQDIWQRDETFEEKDFKPKTSLTSPAAAAPFSSSLENLDTQEFLVDAGIKLPSAASMPNLTSVGKVKDPIIRSNSIPDNSNIDGELAKYLISNEEMEHYEAEYHKAAQEIQIDPAEMGATVVTASNNNNNSEAATPGSKLRGRSETKMRAPSFTSALINRSAPSASATVGSVTISKSPVSFSKPIQKAEKQEARLTPPKPLNNKSNQSARNSPPKSDERVLNQQRWNDGSIERLAEKWAAKRDALLKETGVIGENLQQRKAEMEQKLESVKRSIPKRSLALTPKRLSLCETSVTVNKSESPKEELTKRKSLDADIVLTTESEEDSDEDSDKVDSLPPPPPPAPATTTSTARKLSPEAGSSDSDDSLPPFPAVDKQGSDSDKPLPPPPATLQGFSLKEKQDKFKSSGSAIQSSSRIQLFTSPPSRSSVATFKTVSAPQTSVAVSRQLQAPKRSIADSPRLPLPRKPPADEAAADLLSSPSQLKPSNNNKNSGAAAKIPDDLKSAEANTNSDPNMKTTINTLKNHPSQSKMTDSLGSTVSSQSSKIKVFSVKKPSDDYLQQSATSNHPSSLLQINRSQNKRVSKLSTTHISGPAPPPSQPAAAQFSSFKGPGSSRPREEGGSCGPVTAQKAGKTIVYIESSAKPRLQPPATAKVRESVSRLGPVSGSRPGKYSARAEVSAPAPAPASASHNNQLRTFQSKLVNDKKNSLTGERGAASSPLGSTENIASPASKAATPVSLAKAASKPGMAGPRRSSGLRMWQGGKPGPAQLPPRTSLSRSPSPAQARGPGDTNTSTLPRSSAVSRMRAPAAPHAPHQRRSYGGPAPGPVTPLSAARHSSAPSTPRHSAADLSGSCSPEAGSRAASPVILRHRADNHKTSPSPAASVSRLSGGASMLKRPSASGLGQDSGRPARPSSYTVSRPVTSASNIRPGPRAQSNNQNQSIPAPKSRLPNPPKSFGFSY